MMRAATFALTIAAICVVAPTAQSQELPVPSPYEVRSPLSLHAGLPQGQAWSPRQTVTAPAEAKSGRIPDALLGRMRGGQTLIVGSQTMTAITTGNILNGDYAAGDVSLTDNALSNFNGVGNLLINTGAQVSLQSGMNLIINTAP
jgi:hypothetical protein